MTSPAPALPGRKLSKRDLATLAESWITPELAAEAQLRRVTRFEAGELLGYDGHKLDLSGIAFPYFWPGHAHVRQWRVRRDHPDLEIRGNQKKPTRKYLASPQAPNQFYLPPGITQDQLQDAALPVVIVEGEKKALALHRLAWHGRDPQTHGPRWIALGISGVFNWRRNTHDTGPNGERVTVKEPIPDFGRLNWDRRPAYICFDVDVLTNQNVHRARWGLARELASLGAAARYVDIPPAANLKAIDDLLASPEHGPAAVLELFTHAHAADPLADVRAIIAAAAEAGDPTLLLEQAHVWLFAQLTPLQKLEAKTLIRDRFKNDFNAAEWERVVKDEWHRQRLERDQVEARAPRYERREYAETEHGLWRFVMGEAGWTPVRLTNFTARILANVRRDDGVTQETALRLEARLGGARAEFTIDDEEFQLMRWPIRHLGGHAVTFPGKAPHALAAIQLLSGPVPLQTVHLATGWSRREGQPCFIHAGGAITRDGATADLEVDFDGKLKDFRLPAPPEGGALAGAVRASLRILRLAPPRVTYPLFSAIWRAPLGPCNVSVFLSGKTQAGKSQLAALAQQHFGPAMHSENLPAGWTDTANAIEAKLFFARHVLTVIDDFNPQGADADIRAAHKLADRVMRSQGNGASRGRMGADLKLRASRPPRGMVLATGEVTPDGHSLRARMVILSLGRGDVRFDQLSESQAAAAGGEFAAAMAAYLQWLAPRIERMEEELAAELAQFRASRLFPAVSMRAPDNLAQLAIGFRMFLRFAQECAGLSPTQAELLERDALQAFQQVIAEQDRQQAMADPVVVFEEMLRSALASGRAHAAAAAGLAPEQPQRWGWREEQVPGQVNTILRPQGELIGWVDGDDLYLEPNAAYAVAKLQANRQGLNLAVGAKALARQLRDAGRLASVEGSQDSHLVRRLIQGVRRRVLHFTAEQMAPVGAEPAVGGIVVSGAGLTIEDEEMAL